MSCRVRNAKIVIVLLSGILLSSIMSATNGWFANANPQLPTGSGSWNPSVPCSSPWIVRITDITDNMTGSASLSSSIFNPGTTSPVGTAKRWLTPGATPPGWVSPGPACTIVNSHGTVALFVELDGVKRASISNEDCTGNYDAVNGGTSNGGSFCDSTFNIYDPAIVPNYGTSCASATDPTCYGRIHTEIDHDWKAAHYCGPSTTCDDAALGSQTTTSSLIDFQGFIYWDPGNLNQQSHSFNGWEIHPLTAWRQHQTNPALSASFTFSPPAPTTGTQVSFSASASGGTQPYIFTWSFGDGSTGAGSSTGHKYTVMGSYSVVLTVQDSGSPQQTVMPQQTVNVANPPPLNASYIFAPSSPSVGQSVAFTGSASGGTSPYTFNWRFGDGSTATGGTVTHSYNTAGIYNTQLTVTDKLGAVKNVTQSITIGPNFGITASPSGLILRIGSSNTSRITVSSINSFFGTVSLATSVSPSGLTASLNATGVNLLPGMNASSTLTVSSANPATYTVNITAIGGTIVHTVSIQVRVATGDFSISANPAILTIQPSINGTSSIQLTSLSQFSESISLSALVSQPGLVTSFSPSTVSIPSGASAMSTLTFSSVNYANYTITVTGVSGTLSHSATVAVRVFPASVVVAADSASGTTSLYTTGGQKLIQDSAGKMIAVYVDSSGRISLSYNNADPSKGGWSAPVKSQPSSFAYSWPAAVLVSLSSLRIIVVGGSISGGIVDIPVTISRGSGNNVTGFSFGTPTTLDSSGLGKYTAAILLHNNEILATWGWENTTTSIAKSLRWDPATGWTNLSGSSTIPDNIFVDASVVQYFVPNLIERPDNHNIYFFALRFVSSGRIAFAKAAWSGSGWLWGSQNPTYETNASDADDDAIALSWDPSRSLIVAAYGISGTHTYGVFTLTSADVKTHIDTPNLAVAGDRGWGEVGVQTNTGDYYLFLVSVNSDVGSGTLGYIRMPSGGSWNATITWLNTATDNQVTSLRIPGPNPSLDLLYVEGTSPANVKFVRLAAPSITIVSNPTTITIQAGSTGTTTITLSSIYNFAGTINLSATVSPTGPTPTLTPPTPTLFSGSVSASILNFNPTVSGVYTITIVATGGLFSQSAIITVTVTDFTISSNPGSVTVTAGTKGTSTITTTSLNGLTGTIALSVSVSTPAGLTCTLPASVTFGTSPQLATLSCSATSSGDYLVAVSGTNGTLSHTTSTILFHVVDFSLSASAAFPSQIFTGSSGNSTITVTPLNGLTGVVNLAVSASSPAGLTCTLPASVNLDSSSQTVTLNCTTAVSNTYAVTVTANAGVLGHTTAPITFTIVDFTIAASPVSPSQILAGGTGLSTITIAGVNGPTGTVNTSVSLSIPLGLTCTFPSTVALGASPKTATLSCTSSIANSYIVTVTGTVGTLSHTTATITYTIVDFSISAGAVSPGQILAGGSATSAVTINAVNGLPGSVSLSFSTSNPAGLTCSLSQTSISFGASPQSSNLSCSSGIADTYIVTVTGTDGTLSHTTGMITFTVVDFTLTTGTTPMQVLAGANGTSTITVNAVNGLVGPISLTVSVSTPAGLTCSLSPPSGTLGPSPQLSTLSCSSGAANTYTVTVTGTDGALSHTTAALTFTVVDFAITGGPVSTTQILADALGTSTITVTGVNGFAGTISLTLSASIPSGLTCTLTPANVTLVTSAQTSTLSCASGTPATYTVTVTGSVGTLSHTTATITFAVVDFTISANAVSPFQILTGATGSSQIAVSAANGLIGNVSLTVSASAPAGLTCTLTPGTIVFGTSPETAILSCSASSVGTYTALVTGTDGGQSHSTMAMSFNFVDFTILAGSVSPIQILAGSSGNSTIITSSLNGLTGTIMLSVSASSPVGLSCVVPGSLTVGNSSQTAALRCSASLANTYVVSVTGTDGPLSHSTPAIVFVVVDFSITTNPVGPSQILVGFQSNSTVTLTGVNGFAGLVSLTTNSTSCIPSPKIMIGSGIAFLSCSFGSAGTVSVSVTGTSDSLSRFATVTFAVQDFLITSSAPSITVLTGSTGTSTVTVTSLNAFSGPVNLGTNNPSCIMSPANITGPGNSTVSCAFIGVGNYTLIVSATSKNLVHATAMIFIVQDYGIVASSTVIRSVFSPVVSTITITSQNGFSGPVSLSEASPSGLTCNPTTPSGINGQGQAIVSCTSAVAGNYTLTIASNSTTLTHAATVVFMFGDYGLVVSNPPAISVGRAATTTVTLVSINHFSDIVALSDNAPAGLSCATILPTSLPGSGTAAVSCMGSSAGNYTLQILGISGSVARSSNVIVQISDFSISANPSIATLVVGGNATFTIAVTSLNGYSGTVQAIPGVQNSTSSSGPNGSGAGIGHVMYFSSLQFQLDLVVNPSSQLIQNGAIGLYTLRIAVPSGTQPGNYTITVRGDDGPLSHSIQVTLVITDFTFSSPVSGLSISRGSNSTIILGLTSVNGFQGNLILFSNINPAGPGTTLSPSSLFLVGGNNITLVINVQSNVPTGAYTLTIQATTGAFSHTIYVVVQVPPGGTSFPANVGIIGVNSAGAAGFLALVVILPHARTDRRNNVRRRREQTSLPMHSHQPLKHSVPQSRTVFMIAGYPVTSPSWSS